MGLFQNETQNYCCGYKKLITLHLNLITFFFNPVYIYIFTFILWAMDNKNLNNKIQLGFHCARHYTCPFFRQRGDEQP